MKNLLHEMCVKVIKVVLPEGVMHLENGHTPIFCHFTWMCLCWSKGDRAALTFAICLIVHFELFSDPNRIDVLATHKTDLLAPIDIQDFAVREVDNHTASSQF